MRILAKIGIPLLVVITFAGFFSTCIENYALHPPTRVNFQSFHGDARPMAARFELFVENPFRSAEFYQEILGFSIVEEIPRQRGGTYVGLSNGYARIGVLSSTEVTRGLPIGLLKYFRSPPFGAEIVLEVDDLGAVYRRVLAARYPIQADVRMQEWGQLDFRLFDPDWYYLRITERRRPKAKP